MSRAETKVKNLGVTRGLFSLVTGIPLKSATRLLFACLLSALLVVVTLDHTWPPWFSALVVIIAILPVLYFSYHLPAQTLELEPSTPTLRGR